MPVACFFIAIRCRKTGPSAYFRNHCRAKKQGIMQPGGRAGNKANEPNDHIRSMIAGLVFNGIDIEFLIANTWLL